MKIGEKVFAKFQPFGLVQLILVGLPLPTKMGKHFS